MDRGKVLTADDLERLGTFARYRDVDGDGIPYRTLPGNEHPLAAYFARGTGHNEQAVYTEDPQEWEDNMLRLWRKADTARRYVPAPVVVRVPQAQVGMLFFGSVDQPMKEARDLLAQSGVPTSSLRLRALPLQDEVARFLQEHPRSYVVEMNTDAQLLGLLRIEYPELAMRMRSLRKNDGLPLTAEWIADGVLSQEAA